MIKSVLSKSRRKACWGFWEIPRQGFFRSGCDWEHMVKTLLERHYCEVIWEITLFVNRSGVCWEHLLCCNITSFILFFTRNMFMLSRPTTECFSLPNCSFLYTNLQWKSQFSQKCCSYNYCYNKIIINHYSEPCQFCVFMLVLFCA